MDSFLGLVARHGGLVVFGVVFLAQLGFPVPAVPLLLALGALAGRGTIDPASSLVLGLLASLCADFAWFRLGRWKGTRVLGWLCRMSLEPDTCVSKTQDMFARRGVKTLAFAKFVPGFDTVAPAIAGILGAGTGRFLLWSALGAFVWLVTLGGIGFLFSSRLEEMAEGGERFGSAFGIGLFALLALYLGWKYSGRRRVLKILRMARITPGELHAMMAGGEKLEIVDVRSRIALEALPFVIPGARLITLEEIDRRHHEIPREQDVILYCT
ncbi:MAG TPA: VTT domain-containing protein [Planctomycetota bacterium]|jgi:membrane protein DedA with SNARE-associated domain|nr:VTT domain-containing protein [Planctomycetota bacterium]